MECENVFCVYQKNEKCILDEIRIDICGRCSSCIVVEPETEYLDKLKDEMLKRFEEYDEDRPL